MDEEQQRYERARKRVETLTRQRSAGLSSVWGTAEKKIGRSKREGPVAEVDLALHGQQAGCQTVGVRGRDGYPYLAGSFVWLRAPWIQSILQGTEKQGHEHDVAFEHELGRYGTFYGCGGPTNKEVFEAYIEHFLALALKSGQIVVMDNLTVHKGKRIRELIEKRGAELWYLPPYSPDFNPIEEAFSKVKRLLRVVEARTKEALVEAICKALDAVSAKDARGFFTHCGYTVYREDGCERSWLEEPIC